MQRTAATLSDVPKQIGAAGYGVARRGGARPGRVGPGTAGLGRAWHGKGSMTKRKEQMMSTSDKFLQWDEGLPTKPDVDLLLRTWPEPKVGDRYEYESVAALLRIDITSARFKTVTNVWRRRLLESGFVVECEPKKAFFVAHADEITARTYSTIDGIRRKAKKHRSKLAVAKIENETQRTTVEHQALLMLAIEKDARKHKANILPTTKPSDMPQISPPKAEGKMA